MERWGENRLGIVVIGVRFFSFFFSFLLLHVLCVFHSVFVGGPMWCASSMKLWRSLWWIDFVIDNEIQVSKQNCDKLYWPAACNMTSKTTS